MRRLLAIPAVAGVLLFACSGDETPAGGSSAGDAGGDGATAAGRIEPEVPESIDPAACQVANPPIGAASPPVHEVASCVDDASGGLAIDVSASGPAAQGKPLTITWSVSGNADASSIGFYLEGAGGETPLVIEAVPLCGKTTGTTKWDGKTRACSPQDDVAFCSWRPQPGEYRIQAVVFEGKEAALVHGFMIDPQPAPRRGEARSAPFQLTGAFDANPLKAKMLEEAQRAAGEAIGASDQIVVPLDRYVKMRCESFASKTDGTHCVTFDLKPPLAGTLDTCGDAMSAITRSGTPAYAPGVLTYGDASDKAKAAEPEGTSDINKWVYRSDDGGYWAFEVFVRGTDGQHTNVVRVGNDGAACIVETFSADLPPRVDIMEDEVKCP